VSNLPSSVRVEELEQIFSQFGEVVDISIPKNHQTGETKGYCFIEFDKKESVRKVLQNRQPLYLSNRQIYIQDFQR